MPGLIASLRFLQAIKGVFPSFRVITGVLSVTDRYSLYCSITPFQCIKLSPVFPNLSSCFLPLASNFLLLTSDFSFPFLHPYHGGLLRYRIESVDLLKGALDISFNRLVGHHDQRDIPPVTPPLLDH